jgi:hypothetical protein
MKWDGRICLALATVATLFSAAAPPSAKAQQASDFGLSFPADYSYRLVLGRCTYKCIDTV